MPSAALHTSLEPEEQQESHTSLVVPVHRLAAQRSHIGRQVPVHRSLAEGLHTRRTLAEVLHTHTPFVEPERIEFEAARRQLVEHRRLAHTLPVAPEHRQLAEWACLGKYHK